MAAKAKQADVEEQEEDDKPEGENEQPAAKSKFAFLKFKMPSMKWMIIGGAGLLVQARSQQSKTRCQNNGPKPVPSLCHLHYLIS